MQTVEIKLLEWEVQGYTVDVPKYVESNCNSLTFINYGTSVVTVTNIGVVLQPNQSIEIGGNAGEITNQRFFVTFSTGVGLVNNCNVILKRYIGL
jgi:hypothetical protein